MTSANSELSEFEKEMLPKKSYPKRRTERREEMAAKKNVIRSKSIFRIVHYEKDDDLFMPKTAQPKKIEGKIELA